MTNHELNQYIKHYFDEDKTKSAIMLTGAWGSGKSYYINHELVPFLNKDGKRCVVISLYGIKSVSEISKLIYFELRAKPLQSNNEAATTGKILAKTVARGVTSFFGINLSASENEMQRIYESVDLSDKLIVFEDIERSHIDILELLGYINNLVEQDGIKVVLVANEAEILQYEKMDSNDEEEGLSEVLTKASLQYQKAKEKTVSDTINFIGDYFTAIRNIIAGFNDTRLLPFSAEESVQEIYELLASSQSTNLRTFIYACQKTVDILKQIDSELKFDDKKTIFYSIILFSKYIKESSFPKWEGTEFLSTNLGNNLFPLYYFCYEYIRWHQFDTTRIEPTLAAHKKMKLYQRQLGDEDLNVLYSYFTYSEQEVFDALRNIEEKLNNPEAIPLYEYGKMINYFIGCKTVLGWDYSNAKTQMLNNLRKKGEDLDGDILFLPFEEFDDKTEKRRFEEFRTDVLAAIEDSKNKPLEIEYDPDKIPEYYRAISRSKYKFRDNHRFVSTFDMESVIGLIFKCSAAQLHDLRGILFAVYRNSFKGQFIEQDIEFMEELKVRIEARIVDETLVNDRIIRLQLSYLHDNLQQFISELS